MQYLHRVVAAGILACAALVMSANAQVPTTFSYQGMLCDMAGNAVPDGMHSVTMMLYDVPTGGAPLWSEAQVVTTQGGVFTVLLGSVTPLSVTFDRPMYLGISIDEGSQLVPRTALTAVPYARVAAEALEARSLAPGATGVVTAVNAVQGAVQIEGRAPITVTRSGNVLTIGATGGTGGITGVQNTDGMLVVTNATGPVTTVNVADNALTRGKIAANQLVKSLVVGGTTLTDDVTLTAGSNVTLSASGGHCDDCGERIDRCCIAAESARDHCRGESIGTRGAHRSRRRRGHRTQDRRWSGGAEARRRGGRSLRQHRAACGSKHHTRALGQ
jgi:hypothetical protein